MSVVVGKRVEKRWGALFMCLTTRAIHVELVHTLNTSSCILAIRRFIARRGKPIELISDCGTNFIGASRELKDALQEVDSSRLMEETAPNLRWVFNPPGAPHFGGSWERLIGSVKKALREMQLPRLPTDEVLLSTLIEVEFTVNSRPLTDVPIDLDSEPPLTPNHFLLGSFNGDKPHLPFDSDAATLRTSWLTSQRMADVFWKKWVREYLPTLTRRSKWVKRVQPVAVGDVVVIADDNLPRNHWPRGTVVDVVQARDGQVRRAIVQCANGQVYERPATKIAVLDVKPSVGGAGN
uniref:Putative bel-2 cq-i n=1 Tax=Anopheles braziliensis TaxID=58242 RepID=A0A2M3ZA50_9DIPT